MAATTRRHASAFHPFWQRIPSPLIPLCLFLACLLPQAGCTCDPDRSIPSPRPLLVCRPHAAPRPAAPPVTPGAPTVPAGTIPQSFSVSSGGSATLALPLTAVPGRAGVEPDLSLTYSSNAVASSGILGAGFALSGLSSITRCGSDLAQDGEIRGVHFDAADKLCWSGQRLVVVASSPGQIEFGTGPAPAELGQGPPPRPVAGHFGVGSAGPVPRWTGREAHTSVAHAATPPAAARPADAFFESRPSRDPRSVTCITAPSSRPADESSVAQSLDRAQGLDTAKDPAFSASVRGQDTARSFLNRGCTKRRSARWSLASIRLLKRSCASTFRVRARGPQTSLSRCSYRSVSSALVLEFAARIRALAWRPACIAKESRS